MTVISPPSHFSLLCISPLTLTSSWLAFVPTNQYTHAWSWKIYDFASNWTEKFTYLPQTYIWPNRFSTNPRAVGLPLSIVSSLMKSPIRTQFELNSRRKKCSFRFDFELDPNRNIFTYLLRSYVLTGSLTRGSVSFLHPLWGQYLKHRTWLMPIRGPPAKKMR